MRILMLACFICAGMFAFGQTNVVKVKIYTRSGAVTDGFVKVTSYEGTPQTYTFSDQANGSFQTLTPADLTKIVFDNGPTYETFKIEVPAIQDQYINRKLSQYASPANIFRGEALLEQIVEGKITAYQFVDRFGFSHFFYRQGTEELTYLPNKSYGNESASFIRDNSYKNLLSFLTQGANCKASVKQQIENLQYSLNPMIRVFRDINNCLGSESEISNRLYEKKNHIIIGIMGGVGFTKLNVPIENNGNYPGFTPETLGSRKTAPELGVYVGFLPRRPNQNYVISLEVFYHSYSNTTDSVVVNSYTKAQGYAKFSSINFGPNLRFRFGHGKVQPALEGGIVVSKVFGTKDDWGFTASGTPYHRDLLRPGYLGINPLFGAGIDFPRVAILGRYRFPLNGGASNYNVFSLTAKVNIKN